MGGNLWLAGVGLALGAGLGVAIGAAVGNLGLGVVMGASIGLATGLTLALPDRKDRGENDEHEHKR